MTPIDPCPSRIMMTADAVGGVWMYALELAGALEPHGVEVLLATLGPRPTRDQRRSAMRLPNLSLVEGDYKLEWMDDCWSDVERAGDWLLRLEQDFRPDVVHLNGYAHGALPFRSPVLIAAHSCVFSWWSAVKGGQPGREWSAYRSNVARGLREADIVVAPTRSMLSEVEAIYGQLRSSAVIPNGRSRGTLFPTSKRKMILSAGRLWDEAKNISMLAELGDDITRHIFIAGDSQEPTGRRRPGRYAHLNFLGKLASDELAGWMSQAAIYALPAFYEPFGLSVLEAAMSGCALVLGDIPSLRENWSGAALFVQPDDRNAMRQVLLELLENDALRKDLGERARIRALSFTPERMASGYVKAYATVLDRAKETERGMLACA